MSKSKGPASKGLTKHFSTKDRRWESHELYGEIPLIRHAKVGRDGKSTERWEFDPSFQPPLPPNAIGGDVAKQVFCSSCHVPKYFYVDEARRCIQCDEPFTFSAREQKYWYEVRKFNFHSVPIRCLRCRRHRRTEHALRQQIARAKRATASDPEDPESHLALARAIVEYHERTEEGNLEEAIAAARKAARLWSESPDADLWEGIAQARTGRKERAHACLTRFLRKSAPVGKDLAAKALSYLKRSRSSR